MGSKKNSLKKMGSTSVKSSWKKDLNKVHNLAVIFEELNQSFFGGSLKTRIIWARQSQKQARCYRRLGCYMPALNLIKIHPILDHEKVPDYFIEYIVYHEMLHAVYPPIKIGRRRMIHHKKFLDEEKAFPLYKEAKTWELAEGKRHFF